MLFPSLMSSLDFYGLPKMAYYYARRAYEDRVLCFREQTDGSLIIYGCSETTDDLDGELEVRLTTYEGKVLWNLRQDACLPTALFRLPSFRVLSYLQYLHIVAIWPPYSVMNAAAD